MPEPAPRPAGYEARTAACPSGPWLVLVHGMAQDRRVFFAQEAAFRGRFRLLLVDLPGHGLSADHPGPYGLAEYAAAVHAAMAQAGVAEAHYWGTHTGAGVGLLLACREPARFRSLVLEGPVLPGKPPPAVSKMLDEVGRLAREQGMAAARRHWWEHSAWFAVMRERPAACRAEAHRALVEAFPGGPWLDTGTPAPVEFADEALAGLDLPVLILNGQRDLPEFQRVADRLSKRLPNARRIRIPGGGGFPGWEYPDAVNEAVQAFYDTLG